MTLEMEMEVDKVGSKRKGAEGGGQSKKIKKSYDITGRSPLDVLHHVFDGIEFNFVEFEPRKFKVSAKIDGIEFQGIGPKKVLAKRNLASKALHDLKGITPLSEEEATYACNEGQFFSGYENAFSQEQGAQNPFSEQPAEILNIPMIDIPLARRDPIQVFIHTWPNADINWSEVTKQDFRAELVLVGRKFYGEGRNKKLAKLNLAKAIFLNIYNIKNFECHAEAAAMDVDESQEKRKSKKSKFPTAQLKDLVGESNEEMTEEIVEVSEGDEKKFHATIVVKGTAYEGVAGSKAGAKLVATKKALSILQPKDAAPKALNRQGVDVSLHPTYAFKEHFPDVEFIETSSMSEDGRQEHHVEVKINRRSFNVTAYAKKKARLRLILKIFEAMKKTPPREWKSIDVKKVFEDKPSNS